MLSKWLNAWLQCPSEVQRAKLWRCHDLRERRSSFRSTVPSSNQTWKRTSAIVEKNKIKPFRTHTQENQRNSAIDIWRISIFHLDYKRAYQMHPTAIINLNHLESDLARYTEPPIGTCAATVESCKLVHVAHF